MPSDAPVSDDPSREGGSDFFGFEDPFRLFDIWLNEAWASEPADANAMSLATVDADDLPDVRTVLLKGTDDRGFVFYTNTTSAKGLQLEQSARAALCLHWKSLRRQVRARGEVSRVGEEEADAYFASRPRDSQVGAWASDQSSPMESRAVFEAEIARVDERYGDNEIPRPPHWTGYRITPLEIEFWHDRPFRLHDRLVFRRPDAAGPWQKSRLFP